ncbi:MAG: ferrous iron transport protein B [Candidatus Altiarchaeota archaeon]
MKKIKIALSGNANVGKSVFFNYLTGLHQHIGNWPGKTVEKAEGTLTFKDYVIDVIDLPGIYSFSTFSIEELIARDYILMEKPDVIINIIDASTLERNLFFTIQLIELERPIVIALNQIDIAKKRGVHIDYKKLQELLNIDVVPTIATEGLGIYETLEKALNSIDKKPTAIKYGNEIEKRIEKIISLLKKYENEIPYPLRFVAIKLLEEDEKITELIGKIDGKIIKNVRGCSKEIERIYGEKSSVVIVSERYAIANKFARKCQKTYKFRKQVLSENLERLTTHWFFGYIIMLFIFFSIFYSIFTFGNFLSGVISNFFSELKPEDLKEPLIWEAIVGGFVAGLTLVIPYVLPFYLILSLLEDSGYLPRIAFLLDRIMHKVGLHGKAVIPIIMGYGCNVPAIFSCRILETQRDRLISAFAITLIPCTARSVVIFALVGAYLGMKWTIFFYILNLAIIMLLSRVLFRLLPGEATELIMEMPPYRMPSIKTIVIQTWHRIKSIIFIVFPYYIFGGLALVILKIFGILGLIGKILAPITVNLLNLPTESGIFFIFGIVRKELILIMPSLYYNTTNLADIFTPVQMLTLALVSMYYLPCAATIATLVKEFRYKTTVKIVIFSIIFSVLLGSIAAKILPLLIKWI